METIQMAVVVVVVLCIGYALGTYNSAEVNINLPEVSADDLPISDADKSKLAGQIKIPERMGDPTVAVEEKINTHFANEDHPIANYTNYLDKTGRFNPHKGGNFTMENEQNDLYRKQGITSPEEAYKQKAYVDGQHGRWGLQQLAADDRRQTTSPYVGTTRSLRAVKIRAGDTIVPDKISGTMRPIM